MVLTDTHTHPASQREYSTLRRRACAGGGGACSRRDYLHMNGYGSAMMHWRNSVSMLKRTALLLRLTADVEISSKEEASPGIGEPAGIVVRVPPALMYQEYIELGRVGGPDHVGGFLE